MYIFNKCNRKKFFLTLISPLLFNGLLFGMESTNNKNVDDYKARRLELKKKNAEPMIEELGIKGYKISGSGAYSLVVKPKDDYCAYKFTYAHVENTNDSDNCEFFRPRSSSAILMNKEINNACKIHNVISSQKIEGQKAYEGDSNQPYNLAIKMDYIDGVNLDKYIKNRKENNNPYTITELYNLIYNICNVLEEFRKNGLIYSDIKEENIMMDKDENFTVIDTDSANDLEFTRKNSKGDATEGEKNNMDLIALIEMALRLVCGTEINEIDSNGRQYTKNKFDLLNFGTNDAEKIVKEFEQIFGKIKKSEINSPKELQSVLLAN